MKQPVIVVFRFSVNLLLLSAMKFGLDKPIFSFAVFSKTSPIVCIYITTKFDQILKKIFLGYLQVFVYYIPKNFL